MARLQGSIPISRWRRPITRFHASRASRGLSQATVEQIVNHRIQGRFLGLFGEPVDKVLDVNLALDHVTPSSCN